MAFRRNRDFAKDLARDPAVKAILRRRALDALSAARGIASTIADTGDYKDSLEVSEERLLTKDPAGHIIEWGSVDTPVFAPLRKAVVQVGARYEDQR